MEAQRGARPTLAQTLQKTRGTQARNRISYRLPPEHPAGHRKAQSCITQMHEPHKTPKHPNRPFTSGEDQHHYRQNSSGVAAPQGTSVPLRWHESNRRINTAAGSVGLHALCFPSLTCGRNYYCGKIAFRRELAEGGEIAALQVVPTAEQFAALPLQFFELKLLRFGWSRVRAADVHREEGQLGIDLRRIGERVFVRAD